MIVAMRSHGSEGYLKRTRRHLFGLYFFVSVGCLACFVTCCNNILASLLSYNLQFWIILIAVVMKSVLKFLGYINLDVIWYFFLC